MPEFSCGVCCSSAAAKTPDPTSARKTPAENRRSIAETRSFKNPDWQVDFFFMSDFSLLVFELADFNCRRSDHVSGFPINVQPCPVQTGQRCIETSGDVSALIPAEATRLLSSV